MTTYVPCKKNDANGFVFYTSLAPRTASGIWQANPTLAAGDVKIAIDDGAPANLGTLPAVDADFTKRVKVVLSQAETNGDNLTIIFSDAAGAEWCDKTINIQTAARQLDDHAFPNTSGRGIDVTTGGGVGIDWANIENPTTVVGLSGTTVKTATDVETDTADIQTRLPAALVGGRIDATVDGVGMEAAAVAAIADGVWDEAISGHVAVGTFGGALRGLVLQHGTIGATGNDSTHLHLGGLTYGDDEINNYLLVIFDNSAGEYHARYITDWADTGDLATVATLPFTPEASVDLYWLLSAQSASAGSLTAAQVADAVWDEAQADHVGAGTFGEVATEVADILTDTSTTLQGELDGIQADTEDIQSRLPAALVSGRIDASVGAMAANVMTAAAAAADFGGEIADAVLDEALSGHTTAGTLGKAIADIETDVDAILTDTADMQPKLGTPAGASISADIAAIEAQTDDIGAAGAGLTAVPWNPAWDAEVQSEVDDALVAQRLDELLNADSDIDGAAPPTVGSVFHELMTKTSGSFTYDQTTDSLEALRDNTGTAGAGLTAIDLPDQTMNITGNITGNLSGSVGSVTGAVGSIAAGGITAASIATDAIDADALAADAIAEINATVDQALVDIKLDHLVAVADSDDVADSSIIAKLASKGATPDWSSFVNTTDALEALRDRGDVAWITATGFSTHSAADVWAVATRQLTALDEDSTTLDLDATIRAALGLASANLDTQLSTIDDFLDTEVAAIKAKTDQLTFSTANRVDGQVFGMEAGVVTAAAVGTGAIDADALATDAANEIADALLDRADAIETGVTLRGAIRIQSAVLAGKVSGGQTGTETFRNMSADSKNRVVSTNDSSGNRTALTLDMT